MNTLSAILIGVVVGLILGAILGAFILKQFNVIDYNYVIEKLKAKKGGSISIEQLNGIKPKRKLRIFKRKNK